MMMTDIERAQQEEDEYAAFCSETARFNNRILSARQKMGLSQSQMARVMGVTTRTIKKWEGPRPERLDSIWPPEPACRHATLLVGIDAMKKKRLALDQ
jgi:hypothetical protein